MFRVGYAVAIFFVWIRVSKSMSRSGRLLYSYHAFLSALDIDVSGLALFNRMHSYKTFGQVVASLFFVYVLVCVREETRHAQAQWRVWSGNTSTPLFVSTLWYVCTHIVTNTPPSPPVAFSTFDDADGVGVQLSFVSTSRQ